MREPGDGNSIPFTIVTGIEPLARGNEAHGQVLYVQACLHCHGSIHDGFGRLSASVPILPEDTIAAHAEYTTRVQRLVFTVRELSLSLTDGIRCRLNR